MPVSDLTRLGLANLTNQQLAELALEADQAARRARKRGDSQAAAEYQAEADALADQLK